MERAPRYPCVASRQANGRVVRMTYSARGEMLSGSMAPPGETSDRILNSDE